MTADMHKQGSDNCTLPPIGLNTKNGRVTMGDFTDSDGVLGQGEAETEVEEEMTREGSKGEQCQASS